MCLFAGNWEGGRFFVAASGFHVVPFIRNTGVSLQQASFTGFRLAPCPLGFFVKAWGSLWHGFFVFASGQTEWRWGFCCFRWGWWWRKRRSSSSLPLWHAVSEEPPPFRLADRATHQHARARRQRSGQAVSRGGRLAKRNPGLARARRLLRPVFFVTTSEFHGVPFGPALARLFRQSLRLVMAWLFRFCKRPNGMEVGFSLLSLWWVVAEEECFTVASFVSRSVGRAPSIPFGRKSHASTRQGTQATVRASSVSRGRAGQTESGTRKGRQKTKKRRL